MTVGQVVPTGASRLCSPGGSRLYTDTSKSDSGIGRFCSVYLDYRQRTDGDTYRCGYGSSQWTVTTAALYANKTYTLLATGPGGSVTCTANVTVTPTPPAPTCTLTPANQTVGSGGSAVFTWTTANAQTVTLTDAGTVALNGTVTTAALYANKTYTLLATGPGGSVTCTANVTVTPTPPAPTCTLLPATQTVGMGGSAVLTWATTNATAVTLTDFGSVALNGTGTTSALTADRSYILMATGNGATVSCTAAVVVTATALPSCDSFTASPATITSGSSTTLTWATTNATAVYLNNGVGAVVADGSMVVSPLASLVYQLTVMGVGDEVRTCTVPVTVSTVPLLSCASNVSFTASDTSISSGSATTLTWSTTDVTTVSISGITATTLAGSQSVSPTSDTTYVLTATRGTESINCPLPIDVSSGGGGGGGSSSLRCTLTISDKKITSGEKVTLKWNTTNATDVTLFDDRGKELFSTEDYISSEKKKYVDHELIVKPTRDTTYTLIAERGTRDEECTVKVDIGDSVTVLESRDQQPLIAGISLSQVPYTGFEAGPFMTAMFYLILVAWSLLISYLIVLRQRTGAQRLSMAVIEPPIVVTQNQAAMQHAEQVRPDVFAPVISSAVLTDRRVEKHVPANLPIGPVVVGYENLAAEEAEAVALANPHQATDAVVTDLENRTHAQKALLSSDAIRHFIGTTDGTVNRHETLDVIITEAKKMYPLEDGWIVINESRMRNLCTVCKSVELVSNNEPFIPATIPEGSGSLAEAIVTGNVVAAYQMIGNRPMFALADAAADLDSIYRIRQGAKAEVSELLTAETKNLSNEQIKNMIVALTGALDGTYTDEASAVKMAIMKAVKAGA
jgi:hypothetical protein